MSRYVAFLRGVNVSGINIKMADLRTMFTDLGFGDVQTVLASGIEKHVAGDDPAALAKTVENALRETFGYDAWIVLLTVDTVRDIVAAYPFDAEREDWHPYVTLSSDPEILAELAALADDLDPELERLAPGDGVLYWEVERGHTLDSRFGKASAKKRYKNSITTRNLRTLLKVLA